MNQSTRRDFLRDLGLSAAALPFVLNLPSLGFANQTVRKQRLVIMFSPNGAGLRRSRTRVSRSNVRRLLPHGHGALLL